MASRQAVHTKLKVSSKWQGGTLPASPSTSAIMILIISRRISAGILLMLHIRMASMELDMGGLKEEAAVATVAI